MRRSTLCDIEVLKHYKDIYLVEYTPYGAIEDGRPDYRMYAIINGYNGEDTWDKGATVEVTYESAVHTFYRYAKVGIKKVELEYDTLNISKFSTTGYCLVYSNDGCTDEYKFVYYPDKNKVKILFKSSDTYTEPERDSAEEFLLEQLKKTNLEGAKGLTKKYNVTLIKERLKEALEDLFDKKWGASLDDYLAGIDTDIKDDAIVFTAYAEVGYNSLSKICDALDKVIQKYNKDAYFEPETSGRAVCYLY